MEICTVLFFASRHLCILNSLVILLRTLLWFRPTSDGKISFCLWLCKRVSLTNTAHREMSRSSDELLGP